MSAAAVGNDVVDLLDPDAQAEGLHPRFDAKAFTPEERAWIAGGPGANRRRWSLWAAKEAAHKALRQEAPELGFAPGHYHASLDPSGAGTVRRGALTIAVRVEARADRVHAVAFRGDASDLRTAVAPLAAFGEAGPSRAVRRLLRISLGRGRRVWLARLGRIPRLRVDGHALAVSLSHHGRFVAVARREGSA
jgi:phosphopantetheinyl transferase (holo-ACP synthase)